MIKEANEGVREKLNKKSGGTCLMKKTRCSSTNRITFEKVFQEVLHRKDNEFYCIDSPQLNQQLQELTGNISDKYRSALSTPSTGTISALERKKYINIKTRIQKAMEGLEGRRPESLKDAFMEKQAILTDFLNELANQMERQCRQKADILKYLWNSMVQLLENVAEKLAQKIKYREKKEVEQSLKQHHQYQQLIDGYRQKQEQLSEKSHVQRMTIDSLIYELRFKRKEVNKLYRNQKLLINKLNDFKIENLNMQNNYLDLLSSQDIPQSQSKSILEAKDQVRKNMYSKFAVAGSKKQNKKEIREQLGERAAKIQGLQNLYDEIKSIAGTIRGAPHLVSNLIETSIDNFGLKYDDKFTSQSKIISVPQKITRINAQTQTVNTIPKINQQQKLCVSTQHGYYDKLTLQLINNKGTQSYFQYPKKVQTNVYQTQVNQLELLSFRNMKDSCIVRTIDEIIFGVEEFKVNNFIRVNRGISSKNHKKNYSELQTNNPLARDFLENNFIQDYIQQIQYKKTDTQKTQQQDTKKTKPLKRNSIKFRKQNNSINISPTNSKQRYSSLTSNQGLNRSNDDMKLKKSNFAPEQQHEQSSPQIKINIINRVSSSKPERLSRDTTKKSVTQKYQKLNEREDFSKNGFLQKNNYFNIEIDQEKQAAILKMFLNKEYSTIGVDDMQDLINQSDNQDTLTHQKSSSAQLQTLLEKQQPDNAGFKRSNRRKPTNLSSIQSKSKAKRYSETSKYKDENDMILNLCRSNYQKGHKKIKQKIGIFKYQDEFTSVKDKIQFIARDVKQLVMNKENMLKKTISNKNIKSAYKILMMTFSKAYDAYNKGILRGNLIYPLFQSFALVYGAINNNQIYKKMISFVAALCVNRENTILRFFLFFLGLDSSSKYSQKVTISEVYLCLKLLQKISIDGKVTINIESIYTDTTRIKEQLMAILKEQNIPELLSESIQKRVTKELESSSLYQSSTSQSHLKLNIYNIILLIIQQVIKCKNTLKQNLTPIFSKYQIYQKEMKLPVTLIEVILAGWKSPNYDARKLKALIQIITINGKRKTVTTQQFCSILFQSNLIHIDQLFLKSDFIFRKNWKIPLAYLQQIQSKFINKRYDSEIQKREIQLFFLISSHSTQGQFVQQNQTIQKMKRVIFQRHYEQKISKLLQKILCEDLWQLKRKQLRNKMMIV